MDPWAARQRDTHPERLNPISGLVHTMTIESTSRSAIM